MDFEMISAIKNCIICKSKYDVEKEWNTCNKMLHFQNLLNFKEARENGKLEISDDKSLEDQGFRDLGEGKVTVYRDYWSALIAGAKSMKRELSPEQRRVLDDPRDAGRLAGAACALEWLLGRHNQNLATYLISDHLLETPQRGSASECLRTEKARSAFVDFLRKIS